MNKNAFFVILILSLLFFSSNIFSEIQNLKIISPNGGELFFTNSNLLIKWRYPLNNSSEQKFVITLYKNGINLFTISKISDYNGGKLIWHIPGNFQTGDDFRIRIRLKENLAVNDFSDSDFSIKKREER